MRFYKYRSVGTDPANDYAVEALLKSYAVFSSRKNFNDLFDSKIYLPQPSPEEVRELLKSAGITQSAARVNSWIAGTVFTPGGLSALNNFETAFNEMIDSYPIYCVSKFDRDALLWAHYASSHTGFCIEFEFPDEQPKEVFYRKHMDSIPLLDFIRGYYRLGAATMDLAINQQGFACKS